MTQLVTTEELLIDNEINKKNYEDLKDIFSRESFVPFVGAGPSIPTGVVDWANLYKELKRVLNLNGNILRDGDGNPNYPRAFSNLYKKLSDKSRFYPEMIKLMKATEANYTSVHMCIIDTFNVFVTTNYDSCFEKAYEDKHGKKIKKHYFTCYEPLTDENGIVYLHGHEDINFMIIKEEDYEYFYPTISGKNGIPIIEELLKRLFLVHNLIFIGFSFNDKYIKNFFATLPVPPDKKINHFVLVDRQNPQYTETMKQVSEYQKIGEAGKAQDKENSFYDNFMKMNIKPVVYSNNVFFENMIKELRTKTAETALKAPESGAIL